eukprot:gene10448-2579_t
MSFEYDISDVYSSPGFGWDTRPRYSPRTLVGYWDQERTAKEITTLGSKSDAIVWSSTTQSDYAKPLSSASMSSSASSMRSDTLNQSLSFHRKHESVNYSLSQTYPGMKPQQHSPDVSPKPSHIIPRSCSIRRCKIPSLTGSRSYKRFTARWEPEPIDVPAPVCRSTRLKETLQKKWADEAAAAKASPYTSTCRETYKRLPAIDTGVVKHKRSTAFSTSHLPNILSRTHRIYE